jgi:hypothetical protein
VDILIDKPARIRGYALHRMVAEYMQGRPALWADEGAHLRIRPADAALPEFAAGKLLAFTTKTCVSISAGHKHRYLPLCDWQGRRQWLEKRAVRLGFEVVSVHVTPGMESIETHDGRRFSIDATDFTGLLRVTDSKAFEQCLCNGVGRVGKAFGLNLLIVQ